MKKILFCLIWAMSIYSADYSIIFVHIGKQLPEYLKDALSQARLFNASADIFLIHNQNAQMTLHDTEILDKCAIKRVFCEELVISKHHTDFNKQSPLARNQSRENFWWKTSERFFYLEEFITSHAIKNVFHLENDVMLYIDLSTLLHIFQSYENIAAAFDADTRCIASLMYFKHPESLTKFVTFFAENASCSLNDMQTPVAFKQKYGRSAIDHLPIIMPEYCECHPLCNKVGKTALDQTLYFNKIHEFNSIFDAAALGQYLGGIDPWHGAQNTVGFINETCIFNPSYCSFHWEIDSQERKIPLITFNGSKYRINNLHIHCKNLKKFASKE